MKLEIRHWQMLKALSELGSIAQAADALGISQSALSHRIAEAERRIDGKLFEKEGRRLKLTPAGSLITKVALQTLPILERAEADFEQNAHLEKQIVRLGVASYSSYYWIPDFIKFVNQKAGHLKLRLVASATQNPISSLQHSSVDIVIAPGYLATPGIFNTPLFMDELVLVTPYAHSLSHQAFINPEDLRDIQYYTYSQTVLPGFEYERFIRPSGVIPHQVEVVEMTDAIIELISAGLGVSILSKWAVNAAIESQRISSVQLGQKGLDLAWSALTRESEKKNSASEQLVKLLVDWHKTS
ncbi:LysR family transcriptional regulator [Psychromonas sp. GE-S-Ul-11]|jgi:LysR family transcriptional regulator, regulator for metE and metH|uniref:LysR family transcriptional regulator n=1 Tax=unclassified Psychromonas TaxID=2614957 RepID=UPI00390C759C